MPAMLTRSVRVSEPALRLAERTLAEKGTSFSRLVREMVDFVARTGTLPNLDTARGSLPSEQMLEFEAWADELTSAAQESASYASAPARELLTNALGERYE